AARLADAGVPLIQGTKCALAAVRHALALRDFRARRTIEDPPPEIAPLHNWRARAETLEHWSEADGLALIADYGIPTPAACSINDADSLGEAARSLRYPLVLKTAEGHAHKSDVAGVFLGLVDEAALLSAYDALRRHLGPRALLQETAAPGTELFFGAIDD